jgi:hypothetical protein
MRKGPVVRHRFRLASLRVVTSAVMVSILAFCPQVQALETDQFTLSPRPLVDSGPVLSRRIYYLLLYIVRKGNNEFGNIPDSERLDERFPANRLFQALGKGLPESSVERWLRSGDFPGKPMRYKLPIWDSIFKGVFSPLPFSFIHLAPTINLFGVLAGNDKVGHLLQHGHEYYLLKLNDELAEKSTEQIREDVVSIGVRQERGAYGTGLDGVFSNADLAANYAGMKFYESLTRNVKVGALTVGPLLSRREGRWEIASDLNPDRLIDPFISEHMNEALNPSRYAFNRDRIRKAVRRRCPEWHERYPELTREILVEKLAELRTWHGEDYGQWLPPEEAITLAGECF